MAVVIWGPGLYSLPSGLGTELLLFSLFRDPMEPYTAASRASLCLLTREMIMVPMPILRRKTETLSHKDISWDSDFIQSPSCSSKLWNSETCLMWWWGLEVTNMMFSCLKPDRLKSWPVVPLELMM